MLVKELGLDADTKEDMICLHTDGRTTSIRGLTFKEADAVIKLLLGGETAAQSAAAKMRRKIMSMAHEVGWELAGGKLDMPRLNNWCSKYGYLKKPLDAYTEAELPRLVTQYEGAYYSHLKKV